MEKKYHYVYMIEHKHTYKKYIGVRSSIVPPEDDLGINYFSSSHDKDFINEQKENPSNFNYNILKSFPDRSKALLEEVHLHKQFNVDKNKEFYNRSKQHSVSFYFDTTGLKHTKESKIRHSKASIKINAQIKRDPKKYKNWLENISKNRKGKASGISNPKARSILQVDLASGKIIKRWSTITEAAKYFNLSSGATITACAKGKGYSSCGFLWVYPCNENQIMERLKNSSKKREASLKNILNTRVRGCKHYRSKKIAQIKNNKIVKLWESLSAAKKTFCGDIGAAARGKQKTAGGYEWKYITQIKGPEWK